MKKVKERVLQYLVEQCSNKKTVKGCTTQEIADALSLQRSNVSAVLNKLYAEGKVFKLKTKPVLYTVSPLDDNRNVRRTNLSFDTLIGKEGSLKKCIQLAKAAILYPPRGLHVLLLGPTGVGKTMFAEIMYKFAVEKGVLSLNSPFVAFNCADYANNPQLLLAQLFGYKKGAFTGADRDKAGIVDRANGGILFLDEIHRLPPEGQEMLFMLIDKGVYTPLGDGNAKKSDILIIGATTESEGGALLSTFTRRIPITITIPPLKERPFGERFELICQFFKVESARIGKEIIVTANALRGLMLYDCPGNIGQLKSDIQLGCANAFLRCISKGKKRIEADIEDFSSEVRKGLVLYKNNSQIIDEIIKEDIKLSFSPKEGKFQIEFDDSSLPDSFYEDIEKRVQELREHGIDEKDIEFIMSFEIESYFKKFIRTFAGEVKKEELAKIVDRKLINLVEDFLNTASEKLRRVFSSKVFYGLCLHISSSIERIKKNKRITNHNLKEIIEKNAEEYALALCFAETLEKEYGIKVPLDEVGFISMFLCIDSDYCGVEENMPIVVVAMHGSSTASSMAEVANKLVGAGNVYAYDMSLDKDPKVAYGELKDLIIKKHQGGGVILLVDMGSLGMFGELISEETGIKIKVLDMVTTIMVIECARKATMLRDVNEVCEEVKDSIVYFRSRVPSSVRSIIPRRENIILTVCTTGEGSAVKLKNLIEEKIGLNSEHVQIIPVAASDSKYIRSYVNRLSKDKKILAIVGAINPNIYGIPFISISELLIDNNFNRIKEIVAKAESTTDLYKDIFRMLSSELPGFDIETFQKLCMEFFDKIEVCLKINVNLDKKIGLILHIACAVDRLKKQIKIQKYSCKEEIKQKYTEEFKFIKSELTDFEKYYNVAFPEEEICNIITILKEVCIE
ncbi:sigma 54-interacting transcriptional regulator [Thermoanaerobacterium sp. DL9XJH110]|uniref:sigma 54-interacting transcriptional regulator n=1 Tax=Thermoanaerobacterium sp. DL9XJH110 TaxID=3386643 RepID=UPI003BB6FDB1